MMVEKRKMWVHNSPRIPKPKVPDVVKATVERKSTELVDTVLKPRYIKPPPDEGHFNYVIDIYTKWYLNYFYFCAKYCCPGPNALSPYFETNFARIEYIGTDTTFNLSFMRHTGRWVEIYHGLSLEDCLRAIEHDPWFQL